MFIETWRKHWGLKQDPFSCEDADKDPILSRMDRGAVHSDFERLFGDPESPSPGIVFGEKGSGKSGLRLMMRRKLEELSESSKRVLCTDYVEFDSYLERFRRSVGAKPEPAEVGRAVHRHWSLSDHLDAMLSGGVTELVDRFLDSKESAKDLSDKQKADFLLLSAFYYDSHRRTTSEALQDVGARLHFGRWRTMFFNMLRTVVVVVGVAVAIAPIADRSDRFVKEGSELGWHVVGLSLVAAVVLQALIERVSLSSLARKVRSLRVLNRDPRPVLKALRSVGASHREEFPWPKGTDEATRYDHLTRFEAILSKLGYSAWYVLFDRIDEPSALNADPDGARRFVETILDHKLLQTPGLALKLFLPIELDEIYRNAGPEKLKRMRLDKSNLVPTLEWTGQELTEIANQRLIACSDDASTPHRLGDFFAPDVGDDYVRDTLQRLATPRYAMGFLTAVFRDYARNLPDDLDADGDEWLVPRAHFDVVRASFVDKTNVLRRKLN